MYLTTILSAIISHGYFDFLTFKSFYCLGRYLYITMLFYVFLNILPVLSYIVLIIFSIDHFGLSVYISSAFLQKITCRITIVFYTGIYSRAIFRIAAKPTVGPKKFVERC